MVVGGRGRCCCSATAARPKSPRGRCAGCEVGMIHIRTHAQGNVLVKQMLAAAFKTMVKATRNHVGEILSCGRFAVESITEDRKRPGVLPMTSMTCRAVVRTRPRSQQARLSAALQQHSVRNPWRQARQDEGLDYDARRVPRGIPKCGSYDLVAISGPRYG